MSKEIIIVRHQTFYKKDGEEVGTGIFGEHVPCFSRMDIAEEFLRGVAKAKLDSINGASLLRFEHSAELKYKIQDVEYREVWNAVKEPILL